MKILVTRKLLDSDIEYIKNGLDKHITGKYELILPEDYCEENLLKYCEDADIFLGPFITRKMLEKAKKLKLIQVPWTGMDTFDFNNMNGFDIPVCNTHSNADSVAEIGLALTLDLVKKISYHDRKMREGDWNRKQKPLSLKSRMLSGQNVCVLGCGNIGYRIAKLLRAFGSIIYCVDNFKKTDDVIEKVFCFKEINKAVSKADLIICCLPLTDETKNCINGELFSSFKKIPYIVNVSRAGIINEDDLYNALTSGKIAGFASDVWWSSPKRGETESYPSDHNNFWTLENVVMSPHRAGFIEGCLPHLDGAIDNIVRLVENRQLKCIVDIDKGY